MKMKPIIIKDGPSKKVRERKRKTDKKLIKFIQANFKIQGARITYDIYSMMLLLRDITFRSEHEEKVKDAKDDVYTNILCLETFSSRGRSEKTEGGNFHIKSKDLHHHQRGANV